MKTKPKKETWSRLEKRFYTVVHQPGESFDGKIVDGYYIDPQDGGDPYWMEKTEFEYYFNRESDEY